MTSLGGSMRRIDPDAEAARLAEARSRAARHSVSVTAGTIIRVRTKCGDDLVGEAVAVDVQDAGCGDAGFVIVCAPLAEPEHIQMPAGPSH